LDCAFRANAGAYPDSFHNITADREHVPLALGFEGG
jgi:hypothetical protein